MITGKKTLSRENMKTISWLSVGLALMALSGCASIVDGTQQTLSVKTTGDGSSLADAQCSLKNDKGTWFAKTPGTVTVHRSYSALNIKCKHPGYETALLTSKSVTKGMAFGNILFGGIIGAGVDMSDGAAYNYPNLITVPMNRVTPDRASGAGHLSSSSPNPTS